MNKNYVQAHAEDRNTYKNFEKITSKQWQVYYYLLSISYYNSQEVEDHRYVYKNNFNVSAAARFLGISRPTIYRAIEALETYNLVRESKMKNAYYIYSRGFVEINKDTLSGLIQYSKICPKNIDLLRVYLILKKLDLLAENKQERCFTKRNLIKLLGHDTTTQQNYLDVLEYLALLRYLNLVDFTSHTQSDEKLGSYVVYHLQSVNEISNNPDINFNFGGEKDNSATGIPDRLLEELSFIMPEYGTINEEKFKS